MTSSSIKVSGDTKNMLFLLLACVIKAHLHTEKSAQEGKGKKGNPGKTLTWILSQETATPQRLISTHGEEQSGGTPKTSPEKWSLTLAAPRAATGDLQPRPHRPPVTPSERNHPEHLSRPPHKLRGHGLGEWDTLQDAGGGHLASVQNLWGVLRRKQKLGTGEIKAVWEGGSVEIREEEDKRGWCKLFLAYTFFHLCPLPGHPSLSCLPNTHTAPVGLCVFGSPSGSH